MASDIHFLAISCLCCHNAPAAFNAVGEEREKEREHVHQISFQFLQKQVIPPPHPSSPFFFNLEVYSRTAHNFFFCQNFLSTKSRLILPGIFCKIMWNYFGFLKKLAKNSLYIFKIMCSYLKQQFCEAGEKMSLLQFSSVWSLCVVQERVL